MAVTLFPLFLNHFIAQISTLHAINLFIMKSLNCFGKKRVQDGKCIFTAAIGSLESQCKTFSKPSEFSVITADFLAFTAFLTGLT